MLDRRKNTGCRYFTAGNHLGNDTGWKTDTFAHGHQTGLQVALYKYAAGSADVLSSAKPLKHIDHGHKIFFIFSVLEFRTHQLIEKLNR